MKRTRFRILMLVFVFPLLLVSQANNARADIVKLRSGEVYEGKVKMSGGAYCEITLRDGSVRHISRSEIESIKESPCSWEVYAEKAATCDYSDAKAIMALVEFCSEKGLLEEWRQNLESTIAVDPDNKMARFLLDYEKKDNEWVEKDLSNGEWSVEEYLRSGFVLDKRKRKWLSPDEAKRAAGFILFRGEWKTKVEIKKILFDEEAEARQIIATKSVDELLEEAWNVGASMNWTSQDLEAGKRLFQLALRKDPKNSEVYGNYSGFLLELCGDIKACEEVIAEAKKRKAYDNWVATSEADRYIYLFNYKKAGQLASGVLRKHALWLDALNCSGIAYYYMGDLPNAVETLKKFIENGKSYTNHRAKAAAGFICTALRLLGRASEAESFIKGKYNGNLVDPLYIVQKAALTSSEDEVLSAIKVYLKNSNTVALRDIRRGWLRSDPAFKSYWSSPEFRSIVAPEGADTKGWNVVGVDSEDIDSNRIRKSAKSKSRAIDTSGITGKWGVMATDSFCLFTNAQRPIVVEVGSRLEQFASVLNGILDSKTKKGSEPILRIFRSKAEYSKYMSCYFGTLSLSAYFNPSSEEVVTWAPGINALDSVMPDIYAACVKQRLYADLGAPLPVWLTEGMGLYFSTARYDSKEFRFETGAPHREYLQAFKKMHPIGQPVPDLAFFFTQTRLGFERTGVEGQAGRADLWGFMYFLMKSPDEDVKKILHDYFAALKDKKEQKEALKVIYADIDRQTLSEMMVEFINGL